MSVIRTAPCRLDLVVDSIRQRQEEWLIKIEYPLSCMIDWYSRWVVWLIDIQNNWAASRQRDSQQPQTSNAIPPIYCFLHSFRLVNLRYNIIFLFSLPCFFYFLNECCLLMRDCWIVVFPISFQIKGFVFQLVKHALLHHVRIRTCDNLNHGNITTTPGHKMIWVFNDLNHWLNSLFLGFLISIPLSYNFLLLSWMFFYALICLELSLLLFFSH